MFPQEAFREILLNAVVHKDYSACNPIQISVYEDKIYIWNDGEMPSELDSTEKLFEKHSSKPYNPKLANVFFKSGMIEAWGRGFDKIKAACAKYDGRLPEYNISASGIMVLCKACDKYLELLNDEEDLYLGQSDQDNDQAVMMRIWKELTKYFLDNGNRKLYTEEKERIKLAIDQANNLNELLQVALTSLTIDAHR